MRRRYWVMGGMLFAFLPSVATWAQANRVLNAVNHRIEIPEQLKLKVEFWKAIYTKYTTQQGLLHDAEDLSVIYDAIELPRNGNTASADELRGMVRDRLFSIVRKGGQGLSREERELLSRFPAGTTRARLIQATENIRFQLGQADRFRQGLIRSGYYLKHIEKIVHDLGLPDYLKYLPHVESSFQEYAISKLGAAGLWQLMETTAKGFNLRITYPIDERLDPWLATVAAMKHLKRDYQMLGEWPLAVTAYNHGPGGVRRGMQALGTSDIADIVFRYTSPSFGFASRNFYAQFLAAVEVAKNYQKYFGDIAIKPTLSFESFKTTKPLTLKELQRDYVFTMEEFKTLNPALRPPVLANQRSIPANTIMRVPVGSKRLPTLVASLERRPKILPKETARLEKTPELKALEPVKPAEPVMESRLKSPYRILDLKNQQGWIRLEINETLAVVSEWAQADIDQVREWNGLDGHEQARLGQKLMVKFLKVKPEDFEDLRRDYHHKIREDFFSQYEVTTVDNYQVKRGENLWSLCNQKFDIPPWLLQDYNKDISLANLGPGTKLKIPQLREKSLQVAEH